MSGPGPYVIAYRSPLEAWLWESGVMWWILPPLALFILCFFGWSFIAGVRRRNGWGRRR